MRSQKLLFLLSIAWGLILFSTVTAQHESDLALSVTTDRVVVPINSNYRYHITVQNLGTAEATFVSVTDMLPLEVAFLASDDCIVSGSNITCEIGNLSANESVIVTYQARALSEGLAVNSASVTSAESDSDPLNNTASESVDIVIPKTVDLELSGSISSSEVNIGDSVDLSFIVSNQSLDAAYTASVEFYLPSQLEFVSSSACHQNGAVVRCSWDQIDGENSVTSLISLRAITSSTSLNISASVSHFESDPNPSNNNVALNLVVNEPPPDSTDLKLGIASSATQFTVGEDVEISFTVVNSGPSDATMVSIVSDLPDDITYSSSTDCAMAAELLVCDIGDLAFNAVYTATVKIQSSSVSPSITVLANVTGDEDDAIIVNNVASITLPSIDPLAPTATITNTPSSTAIPIIVTSTPGPTQTPFQVIVTQPVFLTEPASAIATSSTSESGGTNTSNDVDLIPDGVAPSDIYGWTRNESVDLIQVTGRWSLRTMQNASDGAYHESRDTGATLRYPFEGDGFRIGYRSEVHGGSFQILLDGEFLTIYSTDTEQINPELDPARQTFVTQPFWVTPGYHVVDIVCLSDGGGAQGCNIDYIETFVGPPVPIAPTIVIVPTQAIVVENVELISAPPTLAPTITPVTESVIAVDVFVNVDLNTNSQIEPNEGVSGMSVQAIDVSNNTTLATSNTDNSGFVRITIATTNDIVLLIPMLGESFYVRNRGKDLVETWNLMLDPATVPGLIP